MRVGGHGGCHRRAGAAPVAPAPPLANDWPEYGTGPCLLWLPLYCDEHGCYNCTGVDLIWECSQDGNCSRSTPSLYLVNRRHRGAAACAHDSMASVWMYKYIHQDQWKLLFTHNYIVSFTFNVSHVISTTLAICAL
jgi:hypothetical protein